MVVARSVRRHGRGIHVQRRELHVTNRAVARLVLDHLRVHPARPELLGAFRGTSFSRCLWLVEDLHAEHRPDRRMPACSDVHAASRGEENEHVQACPASRVSGSCDWVRHGRFSCGLIDAAALAVGA